MSVGYFQLARGWQDNEFFADEAFSERDAWAWMIEQSAWKPGHVRTKGGLVAVERGDLCFSRRFMADKWQWPKSRVDRFLSRLEAENMVKITPKSEPVNGPVNGPVISKNLGQSQSVLTICNYDKYQAPQGAVRTGHLDADRASDRASDRAKEEEKKELKEDKKEGSRKNAAPLAFEGRVIRLTDDALARWEKSYSSIDVRALLQSRDDWLWSDADEKLKRNWFIPTSNYLAKMQAKARALAAEEEDLYRYDSPC